MSEVAVNDFIGPLCGEAGVYYVDECIVYLSASSMAACQLRMMGYGWQSVMEKSRTLNVGDRMAHCRAQPRDTASSAFRVVLGSLPNTCVTSCLMDGTRVDPPTISTE